MARHHKYVKRTGSPGNYKYWYKMPDGSLKASDDEGSPKEHAKAKREHLRRLIQAKAKGHHRMSKEEMLRHTGVTKEELEGSGNKHIFANAARRGHQWEEGEIATAHKEEEQDKTGASEEAPAPAPAATARKKKTRKKAASRARAAEAEAEAASASRTVRKKKTSRRSAAPTTSTARGFRRYPNAELFSGSDFLPQANGGAKQYFTGGSVIITPTGDGKWKVEAGSQNWDEDKTAGPFDNVQDAIAAGERFVEQGNEAQRQAREEQDLRDAADREETPDDVQSLIDKLKNKYGVDLTGGGDEVANARDAARARAAAARAAVVASPSGATARELHQEEPELAAADEPLARMEEAAREGGNPYLERAKEVFSRIRGDIKPERAKVAEHIFQAIDNLGSGFTQDQLLNEYKRVSGRSRVRKLGVDSIGAADSGSVADEFEKATFMTLDEVIKNEPIDMEYERMRRGYGAMQFARMKPYVKDSWHEANPDAPPPYPTYDDLKSWSEHGVSRPASMSWTTPTGRAGGVTKAMPQEFYDSVAKDASGKPQNPPGNMPLHLMPVWNYVVRRSQQEGQNPYNTQNDYLDQTGRVNLGARAGFQEGMLKNAMRKYVQFRGGADQLPDIPKSAAAKVGMSRADLFKSEGGEDVFAIAQRKIIDPVALLPFVKAEMASARMPEDEIGKSIRLVIDADRPEVNFKKSFTINMSKSEKIRRIKDLKRKFVVER